MQNFFVNDEEGSYDYYDILNVTKSASLNLIQSTLDEIRSNYLELSRLWHPDKLKSPLSVDQTDSIHVDESPFLKIKNAYTVLSDPLLRKLYDKYGHRATNIAQTLYMENRHSKRQSILPDDVASDTFFWDEYLENESPELESTKSILSTDFDDKINSKVRDLLRKEYHESLLNSPISFYTDLLVGLKSNSFNGIEDDRFLKPPSFVFNRSIYSGKLNVALSDKTSTQVYFERNSNDDNSTNVVSAFFNRKIRGFLCKIGFQTSDPSTFGKKCFYISKSISPLFYISQLVSFDHDMYYSKTYVSVQLSDKHKIGLTFGVNEDSGILYSFKYLGLFDIEYLYNIHLSTNDLLSSLRSKYRHNSKSNLTLGIKGTYSYINGIILEYYVRFYTFVETLHKFKIEYRLVWKPGYVCVLCKVGLSNTRIIIPIELFSMPENVGYSVHFASLITLSAVISPIFYQFVKRMLPSRHRLKDKPDESADLFESLDEFLNFDYLPGADSSNEYKLDITEDNIDLNVLRARNECYELYPIARNTAISEAENEGLVVKYAFYGHPKYVKMISILADQSLNFDRPLPNHVLGPVMAELLNNYQQHEDNAVNEDDNKKTKVLTNEDIILFKHFVIDVTNPMQSRVKSSSIAISSFSKSHLIGFTNPCKDNTTCILIIRYTKNGKDITVQIDDDEYLLI